MIKSLYIRIVAMFLTAIMVSLLASAMITGYLYNRSFQEQSEKYMITIGQSLIRLFERVGLENRALVMEDIREMVNMISVQIYDEQLQVERYGDQHNIPVSEEQIREVQQGQIVRGEDEDSGGLSYVGLSFEHEGQTYAMFLESFANNQLGYPLGGMLLTMMAIFLVGGSLFFIVEAGFLIYPLRKMTEATRRMAKGDFSTDLKVRRKDELGVLVQSFDEMRKQLWQIEQMRQDFVSNVSHEIQSPLTSIRGFAKALREEQVDEEARNRYLNIIISESERMSRMSENLLKLASLESRHHPFQPETFRLDEQIRQAVVAFEPQWSAKQIGITLQLPLIKIYGDHDQLNQVWINLIGNCIRFTPEGGAITISAVMGFHHVSITFKDTGIGISAEDQQQIFERFYKADRSRNRAHQGNGLGLAITKKIIDLHHGHINVQSEPGGGTEITVNLPYYSP